MIGRGIVCGLAVALAACGGAGGATLDLLNAAPDGGADGASADGAAGSSGASDGGDAAIANDAAPPVQGVVVADGGSPPNAGPGGDRHAIACGGAACSLATESCCVYTEKTPPPAYAYACVAGSSCPLPATAQSVAALRCSSSANCPASEVCCVSMVQNEAVSECRTSCGSGQAQLCDPTALFTACAATAPCSSRNVGDWNLPSTYATCGGVGN